MAPESVTPLPRRKVIENQRLIKMVELAGFESVTPTRSEKYEFFLLNQPLDLLGSMTRKFYTTRVSPQSVTPSVSPYGVFRPPLIGQSEGAAIQHGHWCLRTPVRLPGASGSAPLAYTGISCAF